MTQERNPHFFLAEETLIPNANKTDASRLNMVSSHFNQFLTPDHGEKPLVFTNFENQVGKYSRAYKVLKAGSKLLTKIEFNPYNIYYIFEIEGKLDVAHYSSTTCLTENYGYCNELITDFKPKQKLKEDTLLYRNNMYDNDLNMQQGLNLKSIFLCYKGLTYEDAVVISESTAKKLTHTEVNEIFVTLNNNDILINWYGDTKTYKPFPGVGDYVKDGVLAARRRINYNFVLDDFKSSNFQSISQDDTIFHTDGRVENIEVYSNMSVKEKLYSYNSFVVDIEDNQRKCYQNIYDTLKPHKEKGIEFSEDLNFLFQKSKDYLNTDLKFSYEAKEFEGVIIKFTISRKVPASNGSKLTGRYGNKG